MNSLLHFLSTFSNLFQTTLFPAIEQDLGALTAQHRALVEALGLLHMDRFAGTRRRRGRPAHSRANILRAFVAKAVFGMPHTRALLDRLRSDVALRRICGWESASSVPDETVFSRAFAEFAAAEAPQRVHAALIERSYAGQMADWWALAHDITRDVWYEYVAPFTTTSWQLWNGGPSAQGPLFVLPAYEVLHLTGLAAGQYDLYFGIDLTPNGLLDFGALYYDSVTVNVTP
jgi:hypothetical protein